MDQRIHLTGRVPNVDAQQILAGFAPSARFANVSFDSYIPDPSQPTQAAAVEALRSFSHLKSAKAGERKGLSKLFAKKPKDVRHGIYLDGGFGVGKTHLLASLYHQTQGKKAFGTFVEYTNLVGALSFRKAVEALKEYSLVAIDEFELDDPGDTVLMSRLMRELSDAGVKLAATSNTLPGSLGDGRFAAVDFKREIQVLADQFEVVRVDGDDYRHRGLPVPPEPVPDAELDTVAKRVFADKVVAEDDFAALLTHLAGVHPSKYRRLIDGAEGVIWHHVETITEQSVALRFVVLADRLYDLDVPIIASGVPFDKLFSEEMLAGGYMKKYYRAVSRLTALAREAQFGTEA